MSRLEELYKTMKDAAPYEFPVLKPYIIELSEIYATECVKASLEKASENTVHFIDTYKAEHSEIKLEITDEKNIVLL